MDFFPHKVYNLDGIVLANSKKTTFIGRCKIFMSKEVKLKTMDGNEAAAYVSYAFTEVATIYPITRPARWPTTSTTGPPTA